MRTTLTISDGLLREAKRRAIEGHTTLGGLVENVLRAAFSAPKTGVDRPAGFTLKTFRGHGLRPGVDLDHSADLLDVMEER